MTCVITKSVIRKYLSFDSVHVDIHVYRKKTVAMVTMENTDNTGNPTSQKRYLKKLSIY